MIVRGILLLLFFPLVLCAQEVRRALPVQTAEWDRDAKFFAGVPLPEGSPLSHLQRSSFYRKHSAAFENLWVRYNENHFTPMRQWSGIELTPRIPMSSPLLYFFAGPDVLAAMAFYPMASDYLLGGLEPVGGFPSPETMEPARLEAALTNLRESSDVVLSYGHFITKEMKTELDKTEFKGVLPLMMAFLAMSGSEILDVTYFQIGPDGAAADSTMGAPVAKGVIPGVRITFRPDPLSAPRRIHYVQADLSNDALTSNSRVLAWAYGFGRANVYLKAASYLMHESYFSKIRDFLLVQGLSVLEDDSGIPLKFFRDGNWRLWFFGQYTGTLDIFKKYVQPEMEEAYRVSGVPLPFGTGYKWRKGESHLLLAVRQEIPKAEPITPLVKPTPGPVEILSP